MATGLLPEGTLSKELVILGGALKISLSHTLTQTSLVPLGTVSHKVCMSASLDELFSTPEQVMPVSYTHLTLPTKA